MCVGQRHANDGMAPLFALTNTPISLIEVARILEVKEASVRSLVHRGLKKLRQMDWLAEEVR